MPRGHGVNTGITLRDWLALNGRGSPYAFYEYMTNNAVFKEKGYHIGNYQTVRTMFYLLYRKLKLIDNVGHSETEDHRIISYYSIRRGYSRDIAWTDPYKFSYPELYKDNEEQLMYWQIRNRLGGASVSVDTYMKEGGSMLARLPSFRKKGGKI